MQKSYVAKTTIHFVDFEFYVRPGDVMVHDTTNHRLTVQRNGQIVKVVKQGPLAIEAFKKNKFIVEDDSTTAKPIAVVSKPTPVVIAPPVPSVEPRKTIALKKAAPVVSVEPDTPSIEIHEPITI